MNAGTASESSIRLIRTCFLRYPHSHSLRSLYFICHVLQSFAAIKRELGRMQIAVGAMAFQTGNSMVNFICNLSNWKSIDH
jgi:hypothetical protein